MIQLEILPIEGHKGLDFKNLMQQLDFKLSINMSWLRFMVQTPTLYQFIKGPLTVHNLLGIAASIFTSKFSSQWIGQSLCCWSAIEATVREMHVYWKSACDSPTTGANLISQGAWIACMAKQSREIILCRASQKGSLLHGPYGIIRVRPSQIWPYPYRFLVGGDVELVTAPWGF